MTLNPSDDDRMLRESVVLGVGAAAHPSASDQRAVVVGREAGTAGDGSQLRVGNSVVLGYRAGWSEDGVNVLSTVAVGRDALSETSASTGGVVAVGRSAGRTITGAAWDAVFIGGNAGQGSADQEEAVMIGLFAGGNSDAGVSGDGGTVAIGDAAFSGSSGSRSVVIGHRSSVNAVRLERCVMIGHEAGSFDAETTSSVAVGDRAGRDMLGDRNVVVGPDAGDEMTGDSNIVIGDTTGAFPTVDGDHNIVLGSHAAGTQERRSVAFGVGLPSSPANRPFRLAVHNTDESSNDWPTRILIDGRFQSGTDSDSFAYAKGVKVRGILEVAPDDENDAETELVLMRADGTRRAITLDNSDNIVVRAPSGEITPQATG